MDEQIQDMRLPPWDVRGKFQFFILYRENPDVPAVQIQLEDGRTYYVFQENFGRIPQITRLPKWEECLRLACAEGQAVYIFGDTESEDVVESAPSENKINEQVNATGGLRADAIRHTRIKRLKRGYQNISPRRGSTSRYH